MLNLYVLNFIVWWCKSTINYIVIVIDVVRAKSKGSIERPACLFRLEVGKREGRKQEKLSDNERTVKLNSEYLGNVYTI